MTRRIDVAGLGVAIHSDSAEHDACAVARLGAVSASGADDDVEIHIVAAAPAAPERPPDQLLEGWRHWADDDTVWIGRADAMVRVDGTRVTLGGLAAESDQLDTLDDLLQFGVAIAATTPTRLMIHGAAIGRDGDALVLVGRSGSGKSTAALAALVDGWSLLGDDLAIVQPGEPTIRAVQRAPMFPADLARTHGLRGELERGARGRTRLGVEVLEPSSHRLVGVVSIDHGVDEGRLVELAGADLETLDDALAVPPFRSVIRRQLAPAATLVSLPTVLLEHAADPAHRVARAAAHLRDALDHCRSAR